MTTKNKILNKALELFNESGSGNISTNHIAKALNMSTGNLYYHYKNKEEIIRELLMKMIEEYNQIFKVNLPKEENQILNALIFDDSEIAIKYKFLYRELSILFKRDSEFERIFMKNQKNREKLLIEIFVFLQEKEYIYKRVEKNVLENCIRIIWSLENFRFFRYEIGGRMINNIDDLEKEERLLERLIPIYGLLTPKGRVFFDAHKYLEWSSC